MANTSTSDSTVISASDWRVAARARLPLRFARLKATTTVVPRSMAAKKEMMMMLKLSASPTPAIASLPSQLTRNVLNTPISITHRFSMKMGTASGVISRQNSVR